MGAGRGRGHMADSQWSPDSTEVVGRTTLADTVPMGYGRPSGYAGACPVDEIMTPRPAAPGPGNVSRGNGRWFLYRTYYGLLHRCYTRMFLCSTGMPDRNAQCQYFVYLAWHSGL